MFTKKHPEGFTLIELLTVIAIVAILGAILIPTVGSMRAKANMSQGVSNLRQIGVALNLHAAENAGMLPIRTISAADWNKDNPGNTVSGSQMWSKLLRDYLPQQSNSLTGRANKVFICPNAVYEKPSGGIFEDEDMSLTYTATEALWGIRNHSSGLVRDSRAARNVTTIVNPAQTVIVIDAKHSSGSAFGSCTSSISLDQIKTDLSGTGAESTSYLDFRQPGDTINFLYVDGRVSNLTFEDVQALDDQDWHGREL